MYIAVPVYIFAIIILQTMLMLYSHFACYNTVQYYFYATLYYLYTASIPHLHYYN